MEIIAVYIVKKNTVLKSLEKNSNWLQPLFTEMITTNKTCKMENQAWS